MRVLIALAEPLPPQASGGSQKVALEVASLLKQVGDVVAVAGRLAPKQRYGFALAGRAVINRRLFNLRNDRTPEYRFFRNQRGFSQVLDHYVPEVVVIHSMAGMPIANLTAARDIPLLIYWHDVEFHKLSGSPPRSALHVANSSFTAGRLAQRFGIDASIIPPIFTGGRQHTPTGQMRNSVLFINPVPDKGLARVLDIARVCAEIPFEFLESWNLSNKERQRLMLQIAPLPNVTLTARQTDMASVYARTKIILVPSEWEEAWGRVVSESQSHGIPVLATRIGGLSEAVGSGGILFSPGEPTETWVTALRSLWHSHTSYTTLVAQTKLFAAREQVSPSRNLALLRAELIRAISDRHSGTSITVR